MYKADTIDFLVMKHFRIKINSGRMKTSILFILTVWAAYFGISSTEVKALSILQTSGHSILEVEFRQQEPGKYGADSATCVKNLSLYREFYKQWRASNFTTNAVYDAIGPWRWVFFNCPAASQNAYIDGLVMMEYFLKKAKGEEVKDKYVDTLLMIHDQRIKYFGREGFVLGRKASDLIKYRPEAFKEAYPIFKRSIELQGNASESFVVAYYFRVVTRMADEGLIDKGVVVEVYDQVMQIIDHNIAANSNNQELLAEWQNVRGTIDILFEPYATCDALLGIFGPKFQQNPNDVELLKKITTLLDNRNCTDSQLFLDASVKLHELEPSPTSALMIGKMLIKRERFNESIPYLENALKTDNENLRADILFIISNVYRQLRNFPVARRYALQSLELKPNNGQVLISIGDMYAMSSNECGDNELTKKAVFWAAVDKYIRARQVDPEVAEIAQSRIALYSQQFPNVETIFFYNLKEGDDYLVECWINERTKVRAIRQ